MKDKKYFDRLLGGAKIGQLLRELLENLQQTGQDDLHENILLISSRFNKNEERARKNLMSDAEYNLESNRIINSIKDYLKEFRPSAISKNEVATEKKVFISYNQVGIGVTIDSQDMIAGDDIKRFIEESIKNTDVTLSLVSPNSLMSAWVSMESTQTFYAQKIIGKKFIAAFIEGTFFKRDYADKVLNKIDKEINSIKKAINIRLEKNRNITDLQTELERYNDLNYNLPKIIQRLKDSLSVNIANGNFETGIAKIIQSVKS
jgi:hypothetical protein